MASDLAALQARAEELASLAAGRCLVAVVGEFKRGKSTLVNALVGEPVLPTGVVPLTAVATELGFGEPAATVVYLDGRSEEVAPDSIASYVTESANPRNTRRVARVEVRGWWPLLEPGAVLVDTPGLASVHEHNTEAGRDALLDADGAVVVLSADAPLSEREADLLQVLRDRRAPTFFVLNKADHLRADELAEVRRFVVDKIEQVLDVPVTVFAVDARSALAAGDAAVEAGIELRAFADVVSRFIAEDLTAARLVTARRELARLGASISGGIAIERAARAVTADKLATLVERFNDEADVQRRGFVDDRTLLARDVAALGEALAARLADIAQQAPREHAAVLTQVAEEAPRSVLADELRRRVEAAVEQTFNQQRGETLVWVEQQWRQMAGIFRARVQRRVDAARQAAAEVFEVPLPRVGVPELAEQRDRFSFLFVRVGSTTEPLGRAVSRLAPARWARRRALAAAKAELAAELDKHAGRARWDVAQRLDAACLDLEQTLRAELEGSIAAIAEAAERARRWQAQDEQSRHRAEQLAGRLQTLGSDLAALGAAP